jgi:hypothetical protein
MQSIFVTYSDEYRFIRAPVKKLGSHGGDLSELLTAAGQARYRANARAATESAAPIRLTLVKPLNPPRTLDTSHFIETSRLGYRA